MHKFKGGMQALPKAFISPFTYGKSNIELSQKIKYEFFVTNVQYQSNHVEVTGITAHGQPQTIRGSRVLLTVPITILKNISFTPPLPPQKADAISEVHYTPSTKVLLQFKERFWEKQKIRGGFSKSTDTLGQLHYPTRPEGQDLNDKERGVLISYTWNRNALVFGAEKDHHSLLRHAVQQVKNLHRNDDVDQLFEGGQIQAWYNDPFACGAFVYYDAYSQDFLHKLARPINKLVFFSGEGISVTHGWIQGALESGLLAALLIRATFKTPVQKAKL